MDSRPIAMGPGQAMIGSARPRRLPTPRTNRLLDNARKRIRTGSKLSSRISSRRGARASMLHFGDIGGESEHEVELGKQHERVRAGSW